jgi:hypothetical protein
MSTDRRIGMATSPASPRPILIAADPVVSSKAVIVRPTPRRPGQEHAKARSHDDVAAVDVDSCAKVLLEADHAKRSLTDPRQTRSAADGGLSAMEGCLPAPVRMRSAALSSPPTKDFGPSKEGNVFVTNLVIDKSADSSEDSGYQILSQRDEEVERGLGGRHAAPHRHHFPLKGPAKVGHKVRSKKKSTGHEHLAAESSSRLENASSRLLDVKAALERLKQDAVISTDGDLDGDDFDEDDDDDEEEDDSSTSTYSTTSADSEFEATLSDKHSNGRVSSNGHGQARGKQSGAPREARAKVTKNISQDTLNTTVISADEFVWIGMRNTGASYTFYACYSRALLPDSHNRLVELQQVPWTTHDLVQVIARALESDCDHIVNSVFCSTTATSDRIGADVLPRISYYLQRALVR